MSILYAFIGSPCCRFSYYNYISIWPYYIVIQMLYTGFNPLKPCLQSMALCGIVCALSIADSTFTNWSIVSLLIWFDLILKCICFCILLHDYNLFCNSSPYYNVIYYNYISIWPYYIVIHYPDGMYEPVLCSYRTYSYIMYCIKQPQRRKN